MKKRSKLFFRCVQRTPLQQVFGGADGHAFRQFTGGGSIVITSYCSGVRSR